MSTLETVLSVVVDSHEALGPTRVTRYVPLLTHRFARDRLRSSAISSRLIAKDRPHVLFVCVHNAGRSQMAAALLHHRAADRVVVQSAGSAPATSIGNSRTRRTGTSRRCDGFGTRSTRGWLPSSTNWSERTQR